MKLCAWIACSACGLAASQDVQIGFNAQSPLKAGLEPSYLSVTIDTASIYSYFDFTNPILINLVKQMGATVVRIGGTASDNSIYTGAGGAHGQGPNGAVAIDNTYWDEINYFQQQTGADILWDLCRQTNSKGAYDPSINATALFAYTESKGYNIYGWEVGNELTSVSPTQYAADLQALQAALKGFKVGQFISSPSTCCNSQNWVAQFMAAAKDVVDLFSMHDYPLNTCTLSEYVSKTAIDQLSGTLSAYRQTRDDNAPGMKLNLEETATQAGGGCDGLSNRYVSGFYYVHAIGMTAEHDFDRINRQDVAGYSFVGRPSHYTLAGPPGWTNGSLAPHPDWYTHVLWKQVMGNAALQVNVSANAGLTDSFAAHVWCTNTASGYAVGSIALAYVNYNDSDVTISVAGVAAAPRTEYILTPTAEAFEVPILKGVLRTNMGGPPASLQNDQIFLNGQLLNVTADGMLPVFPIPGNPASDPSKQIVVPAYSYGFFVFSNSSVNACGA